MFIAVNCYVYVADETLCIVQMYSPMAVSNPTVKYVSSRAQPVVGPLVLGPTAKPLKNVPLLS